MGVRHRDALSAPIADFFKRGRPTSVTKTKFGGEIGRFQCVQFCLERDSFMQLNDLSLAPTPDQDPDVDLVWSTQWFVPSSTDPNGGKNVLVYAESTSGGPLQCFVGENVDTRVNGGDTNETKSNPGSSSLLNTWD